MDITRRDAIALSGSTLAGLSLGVMSADDLDAQSPPQVASQEWPTTLVERLRRKGFPASLLLNPDGSTPEHPESEAGPITPPLMWRTPYRTTPPGEYDYRRMTIKVDTRGLGRLGGTLRFSDLGPCPASPTRSCSSAAHPIRAASSSGRGVRFSDFADMLGLLPGAHYGRFIATDRFYVDEDMDTLRHPQVMLAWLMNDEPVPPDHGAPLRLIIPFRYGNRSIKAITEMVFSTPGLPALPLPG